MQRIDVRFKINPKVYSFSSDLPLEKGDFVIVETAFGDSFGKVENVAPIDDNREYKKVIRKATEQDERQYAQNLDKEREAISLTKEIVERLGLEMDVVNAEYSFDGSKVIIDFISESRVDFRTLVKELASVLHTRIELRQIGIRDQAKMVGGIGICGRVCCCASHLRDFEKVSIKMAKVQGLSLNPSKISGACGRLMCCLEYENPYYTEMSAIMPKLNSTVVTKDGAGTVVYENMLKQTLSVKFTSEDGSTTFRDYKLEDIKKRDKKDSK